MRECSPVPFADLTARNYTKLHKKVRKWWDHARVSAHTPKCIHTYTTQIPGTYAYHIENTFVNWGRLHALRLKGCHTQNARPVPNTYHLHLPNITYMRHTRQLPNCLVEPVTRRGDVPICCLGNRRHTGTFWRYESIANLSQTLFYDRDGFVVSY